MKLLLHNRIRTVYRLTDDIRLESLVMSLNESSMMTFSGYMISYRRVVGAHFFKWPFCRGLVRFPCSFSRCSNPEKSVKAHFTVSLDCVSTFWENATKDNKWKLFNHFLILCWEGHVSFLSRSVDDTPEVLFYFILFYSIVYRWFKFRKLHFNTSIS